MMKRKVMRLAKLALAVCMICTLVSPAYALSAPIPEEEFLTQLREDTRLSTLTSEDDVIDYVTGEGEKAAVSQSTIDKTIKEVMKGKSENARTAQKKVSAADNVILQKKQEHMEKIEKVEKEIQKYVDYDTEPNKAENIEFLLNNSVELDEELIFYYISGYAHHVKDENVIRQLEEYLNITSDSYDNRAALASYNRTNARAYARDYCGDNLGVFDSKGYNTSEYPVYSSKSNPDNDCANFGSQCLKAGGMQEVGSDYKRADHWFCDTNDSSKLELVSLTWRHCPSFKKYWQSKAADYKEVKERDAYYHDDFVDNVWDFLYYGDIIHLADKYGAPYHTLVVTAYSVNGTTDIGYTCHSVNQLDKSLYQMTALSDDLLLLYHFE